MKPRTAPVLLLAFVAVACSLQESPTVDDTTWVGTITTEGNVTTVVNESGSVWGSTARLVEEMSIGSEDRSEEYVFGLMGGLATDGKRIFVTDRQASVVRVYDLDGQHLMSLGGPGEGPGEMRSPKGIGIAGDGRILVQDNSARKIHVFDSEATFVESWQRVWWGSTWDERFTVTLDGRAFIREVLNRDDPREEPEDWQWGMVAWGSDGRPTGAAIEIPYLEYIEDSTISWGAGWTRGSADVPFVPRGSWMMARDTTLVTGFPDTYRFEIRHPGETTTIVERVVGTVHVQREEFEWFKHNIVLQVRERYPTWNWSGPRQPRTKPAFEGLFVDDANRVWVRRELAGEAVPDCAEGSDDLTERLLRPCWRRPRVFDIFGPDGRLLTTASYSGTPTRQVMPVIEREIVLVPEEDALGNLIVKRYRLVLPGEEGQ